ncbi:cellulase family glycosylhydrolase [Rahnella sp. PD12R]|uniref:cellulase family glycosylhydrolase n=1 Tax=Rahnella sp. PD12R TaxID=2855688 RepID=UPI002103DCF3|nr:cellulase family glycosylhydrolase [Rahnella sp. PD12R]
MSKVVIFMKILCLMIFCYPFYGMCTIIGVGTHFQGYRGDSENYLVKIKSLGFTSFREDYPWSNVEKTKGSFAVSDSIRKKDSAFLKAKGNGLEPVLILDYGNKFYNDGDYPRNEESINAFVKYATWTATRFKGKVKYYEVWNEWTIGTGMTKYRKNIPSAEIYFNLVKATSEAIKKIDPDAIILAGGFNPLEQRAKFIDVTDTVWFSQLLKLGILNYADGISIHTYSYLNGRRSLRTVEGNLDYLDSFHAASEKIAGKGVPFYITEIGVTNYTGPGGMKEDEAANYIKEYIKSAITRNYIKGVWIYDLIDDGKDKSKRDFNFGLLNNDLSPKQAAPVVSQFLNGK